MSSTHHEHRGENRGSPVPEAAPSGVPPQPPIPPVAEKAPEQAPSSAEPGQESAAETAAPCREEQLARELATAKEELSSLNDKYLRKLADDVNFRKRMAREREDAQRFALVALLGDIIPVLDDFDRAIASAETAKDYAVLHDGVLLIRRQLGQMLENKYGLRRLESLGKPFDPNHHEAVAMEQAPPAEQGAKPSEHEDPVVSEEFLPGYGLHERVIRTAKVRVRMPAPQAPAPSQAGEGLGEQARAANGTAVGAADSTQD